MYRLGDEQQARWWTLFRDIFSPHRHKQKSPQKRRLICMILHGAKLQTSYLRIRRHEKLKSLVSVSSVIKIKINIFELPAVTGGRKCTTPYV
jgi:hypothetical protein